MRNMCLASAKLLSEYTRGNDKWFVATYTRLFHYLEIILTIYPIVEFKGVKELKEAFDKTHGLCSPVLYRLKELCKKQVDEITKLQRIENRIEISLKELNEGRS